jgi:hypothetical protein
MIISHEITYGRRRLLNLLEAISPKLRVIELLCAKRNPEIIKKMGK